MKIDEMGFEEALERLEEVVKELEDEGSHWKIPCRNSNRA